MKSSVVVTEMRKEELGARTSSELSHATYVRVQKQLIALSQGHFVIDASAAGRYMVVERSVSYCH